MTAVASPELHPDPAAGSLASTARTTGLLYLGVAVTGMLGFLVVRSRLFEPDDAGATLRHLVEHPQLARFGIALELGVVLTQVLAALWFFRLFRSVDAFAAGAIVVFGVVNAMVIVVSAAFLATALQVAQEPVGDAGNAQLMYLVSDNLWGVGNLFFGLWLVPMGWCVLRAASMPRALGWLLVAGGGAYVLSAFVWALVPDSDTAVDVLAVLATIGELWMIGDLLTRAGRLRSPVS